MSESKIAVPEGMLNAAVICTPLVDGEEVSPRLQAALRWLAENPIVPTDYFVEEIVREYSRSNLKWACSEWQRRMFLALEPEVDPLVSYIMRHFSDIELDPRTLRNRAETAVSDFHEHEKRNARGAKL